MAILTETRVTFTQTKQVSLNHHRVPLRLITRGSVCVHFPQCLLAKKIVFTFKETIYNVLHSFASQFKKFNNAIKTLLLILQ